MWKIYSISFATGSASAIVSAGLFQRLGLICNLVPFVPTSARRHSLARSSSSRQSDKCDRYPAPCPFHLSFTEGRSPYNQPTLCPRLLTFDQKSMPSLAHCLSCI
ncbi:hypothetical protein BDR03DRAFT_941928 [Suillus americanus]|nr:hypothetical protein BDR03DRAFT_941928 [Suillus americanus]